MKVTLTRTEVAALLGISETHFREHRRAMEADGFPVELAEIGGWSRAAVEAWVNRHVAAPAAPEDLAARIRGAA
jgi:predicted DNA-binding transcriptional regulator AlpA